MGAPLNAAMRPFYTVVLYIYFPIEQVWEVGGGLLQSEDLLVFTSLAVALAIN